MSMESRARARQVVRGLYGIADSSCGDPLRLGEAMLEGGCRLVQLRAKDWDQTRIRVAAQALMHRCSQAGATFVVNDSVELTHRIGATALHLGQLDGPLAQARTGSRSALPLIVGRSTHSVEQALAAWEEGADYIAFGPCFETPNLSRPKPVRGLERLAAVRAALPPEAPLVAIGGITPQRLNDVRAAGATAWAVIGAIGHAPDPVAATRGLLSTDA